MASSGCCDLEHLGAITLITVLNDLRTGSIQVSEAPKADTSLIRRFQRLYQTSALKKSIFFANGWPIGITSGCETDGHPDATSTASKR
jgi:hypothetical protein